MNIKERINDYIKKSTSLKTSQMPEEVTSYFVTRFLALGICAILGLLYCIYMKQAYLFGMLFILLLIAFFRILFVYFGMSNESIVFYEGKFKSMKSSFASAPLSQHTFGKTTIEIVTDAGIHITAGVKAGLVASPGDIVRVYGRKSETLSDNNSLEIPSPIIVKVIRKTDGVGTDVSNTGNP